MIVGSATVVVSSDATAFGPKTEAAVKKALAGVKANIELTIDSTGLRAKVEAAVKAAGAGAAIKVGTDVDAAPIKAKVAKAVADATSGAGTGQLDIFDVDPAKLVAEITAAREAARVALAAGKQLELELDFDGARAAAEVAAAIAAAEAATKAANLELELKVKVDGAAVEAARAAATRALAGEGLGGQTNLFDIDPADLVAKVVIAKEAARAALTAGEQLQLDLDFDGPRLVAEAAAAAEAAHAAAQAALASLDADFKIRTSLDSLALIADAERALAGAEAATAGGIDVEFEFDFADSIAKANAIVDAIAASLPDLDVEMSLDDDGLRGDVTRAVEEAQIGQKIKIPVGVGSTNTGEADTIGAAVGGTFGRAVLRTAVRVLAAGGIAQLLTAADAGAVALGGSLLAAASAAGSLVGTVAVLPGLLSAAAQAASVVALAFGGIKGAFQAFTAEQKAVGAAAAGAASGVDAAARAAIVSERAVRDATRGIADAERSMADAVESATERVAGAVRSFEDAQRSAAETAETAARRVADAEQNLADTHRRTQSAQEDLTQARRDASEELDHLRDSVESLSLSEEEAALRILEIQDRIRAGQQGTSTHPVLGEDVTKVSLADRNQAERDALALKRAQLSLVEATKRRIEAQEKLNKAEAAGVDGSKRVIDATERLEEARRRETDAIEENTRVQRDAARSIVEANQRVIDTQAAVGKSQRDLARAQEDGAERVALAQERLADAVADAANRTAAGASGAAGAINRFQAALDLLNPFTRRFVEFLISLQPRLKELQTTAAAGLLPGIEESITTLLPLLDVIEPILFDTGKALAGLAIEAAKLATSPAWRADIAELGRRNIEVIRSFGRASLSTADLLRNVVLAAGPLTQHIADLVENLAGLAAKAAEVGRDNGHMEAYFRRVGERLDKLLVTTGLVAHALLNIFKEATPAGDRYFDSLERLAAKFDIIVERAKNNGALREFFESTREPVAAVTRLLGDVASALVRIGQANFGKFGSFVDQLDKVLLPVLEEILGTIDAGFLSSLVNLAAGLGTLFEALLGANPALTVLVNFLAGMAKGVASLLTDIPVLSPLLLTLVTTLSALGTVAAVIKIEQLASRFAGAVAGADLLSGAFQRFGSTAALSAAEVQASALAVEAAAAREAAAVAAGFEAVEAKVGLAAKAVGLLGKGLLLGAVFFGAKQAIDAFLPSMDKFAASIASSKTPLAEFEASLRKINKPSVLDQLLIGIKHPVDGAKILLSQLSLDFKQADKDIDAAMKKIGLSGEAGFKKLADASQSAALRVIADAKAQGKNTEAYERILEDLIQEKAKQGIAEDDVRKRIEAATGVLKGNNAEMQRHIEKMKAATVQALSLSGAETSTEQAFADMTKSLAENGRTFDVNTEKGRNNRRALDDLVRSISAEVGELEKAAAAGGIDNERKEALLAHLRELETSGYPGAAAQAENLRNQLNAIEGIYTAAVHLDTREAEENLAALQRNLNSLEANQGVSAEDAPTTSGNQREFGGRVERNRAYIVGEKRPELFIPDVGGMILPTVPDLASLVPMGLSQSIGDINVMPSTSNFDADGLEASLHALEEALTAQLAATQAQVAPLPTETTQEPVRVEIDYDALARAFDKNGSRTVNIDVAVSSAMPAEVGADTARNLRNAVYLEMGP